MLDQLRERLSGYQARSFDSQYPQASVLIALTDCHDPHVILTKRAIGLSTHGGEIAFPGGRHDVSDPDLLFTALREAHEEIGLLPEAVEVLAPLGQVMSKHMLQVTPWVGIVPASVKLIPSPDELESVFTVPLSFFLEDKRHHTDEIHFKGMTHFVPAYEYDGHIIWGLTAYMLVELLNIGFDARIPMKPRPEYESGC
ncbi:CoA pyrophosphatase [Neptunomonas antarctica]|uniref:NUDIX domain-containing protein n=1 Tax=Neptunomonas antarctica TaxID=619304 RepID=A0A1N7J6K3_9GAMM|nr:CoA pyrophosphatase [Neptunomonas antarctica]SIS44934.1 NUDIX domain-containing protein [Neptunomonas antarctica]